MSLGRLTGKLARRRQRRYDRAVARLYIYTFPYHRDGVPWYASNIPPRWHRCRTQSIIDSMDARGRVGLIEHCPCGAVRYFSDMRWSERNSQLRSRQFATLHSHI